MALFCRTDRLHGDAILLTKEEQISMQEASISALTGEAGRRAGRNLQPWGASGNRRDDTTSAVGQLP